MNQNTKDYINHMNFMAELFGREDEIIDLDNIDEAAAKRIMEQLDMDLSPENLHCDGEISAAGVRAKKRKFADVIATLRRLGYDYEG